jgi:hypothetical protein
MNAISKKPRRIDQPEPGFFKLRLVRKGPWVGARISQGMGLWSATINGQSCGAPHPDPFGAEGVSRIWETGTAITAAAYDALLASPPATPTLAINLGAMPPITFEEPAMNAIAGIGHNAPPVDLTAALEPEGLKAWIQQQLATHAQRATALTTRYKQFLVATTAGIANDNVDERAVDFANQIRAEIAATDATRTTIKAPVLAAQRAIDGAAKVISDQLLPAYAGVQERHTAYLVAKDKETRRLAAEEAARLAAEVQRQAAESARMEAAVQRLLDDAAETGSADAMEQAVVAAAEQEAAAAAHEAAIAEQQQAEAAVFAPTQELTRVRTGNGSTSSLRDNWVWSVADAALIPAAFLMPNDKLIAAAIKTGTRSIPGIKITNQPKASIR